MENKPTILFEDTDVCIINKPAGLIVHGDGRSDEYSVATWVLETFPDMQGIGEPWERPDGVRIERPGIVHRLDKDTSGIMVLAKHQESFGALKEAFSERAVEKTYRAYVYGTLKDDRGLIDKPIGKSKSDFRRWSAQPGSRGTLRDAQTHWVVLSRFETQEGAFTYLELSPKTGRTHQLRVHLKAIHHPIVCDALYAPKQPCVLGFSRLALHAYSLRFTLFGTVYAHEAPLPVDFTSIGSEPLLE